MFLEYYMLYFMGGKLDRNLKNQDAICGNKRLCTQAAYVLGLHQMPELIYDIILKE